ncbi:ABC transporter ATP-binding protein [Christensenellaceae bacterium NSJ-63]|uniref:ABC transporter ATP-binding protein n=1 Tax=Guopingia tenuis TaxID=2763656 RepID=A0A926DH92_9FIRM|nr:ABC transporter ATP-binding protein [Guopingia tenuis]MBC8538748.1 ABC transporter ATP-binding protein [Guopingia tenuis]
MKNREGFRKILQKLYGLLDAKQKRNFAVIILIMIASAGLSQITPKAIGWLTDDILVQKQIEFLSIIPFLLFILAANVGNEMIKIIRRVLVEDTATKTEKKARGLVIRSLLKAPLSYFKKNMTGNIHGRLNRCLEGTVNLEKLLFMDFAPAIFNSIAAIVVIFMTLPVILALPMLLVIPIGMAIVFRQISTQRGIRVELLETKSAMDGTIVELLNGIEVIRIADSTAVEEKRFDGKSEFLRKKEMKHHKQMAKYDCLKFINEAIFTVLMIGISTYLATRNIITVGSVLTAYLCFAQLIKPLEELHRILDELSECMVLAEDFFRMTDLPSDFSYETVPEKAQKNRRDSAAAIEIRDLTFCYEEGDAILNAIELNIQKGMFLGIAGPSGCGKSSLIKAICRLEKCQGDIFINGRDINSLSRKDISKMIALVPQNPFLIAGTIYENICYGLDREISLPEVEEAARKAYIYEFIESLPDKFETAVSEGGNNLSGGQKQRIAIARIFLRKPEILILDEATSALDNTSEKHIQMEIERMKEEQNMTIISIAHRLTTLKNCDRIIVLHKGNIEQTGRYDDLIQTPGIFSDMYYGRLK